jgi:hypothetical protein
MKRFKKSGMIIGLLLMAFGLVFAGCTPPGGDSSSEGPAATVSQTDYATVPITINDGEEGRITIGDEGNSFVVDVGGHNVEIRNGTTSTIMVGSTETGMCEVNGSYVECWIRMINRDPTDFMANAIMFGTGCIGCVAAIIDNADLSHGSPTHPVGGATTGLAIEINGLGMCYVEDGTFVGEPPPFTVNGCETYNIPSGTIKPFQMLHPECGMRAVRWDFGGQPERFGFEATVMADFITADPLADGRYDFADRATWYLILVDLLDANPALVRYDFGSWKRSNVLAGWGAASNGVTLAENTYFSVNIALDYSDRIESQFMGVPDAGSRNLFTLNNPNGYEYYNLTAALIKYNPHAVGRVMVNGIKGAPQKTGSLYPCAFTTFNLCQDSLDESSDHLDPITGLNTTFNDDGWISVYRSIREDFFYYKAGNYGPPAVQFYGTDGGGAIGMTSANYVLREGGHNGVAEINRAFLGGTITWKNNAAYTLGYGATQSAMTQQGPDVAPESTPNMFHFYTLPGASGTSSEFSIQSFASFTYFMMAHTGGDGIIPGGVQGSTGADEWTDYCAPFDVPFCTDGDRCCDPGKLMADYVIFQGVENANPAILQSGEVIPGEYGGAQGWNVYVCVQ